MKKLLLLLLFIPLVFSCSSSDEGADSVIKLTFDSTYSDYATFSTIILPNQTLTVDKEVQTFTIENLSSTSDVKVTFGFECQSKPHNQDVMVNFYKGQTTTIKLTKLLQSSQGCSLGFTVSYN
tara:strand:- start:325 stop:693 length:369 start_codon:yes stop_codon:yes gene_type:complete